MTPYVLLSEFFPPDHGGIQASLGPMAECLGDRVTVIAPHVTAGEHRLRRSLFSGHGWPHWWWLVAWLRTAREQGMQLAMFGHFSSATIAALISRVPYALFISGNDLFFEQRRWPVRWLIGPILRRAKWIGVDSQFVQSAVTAYGVPQSRCWFSHPFVTTDQRASSEFQRLPGRRLITVARLVARKNVAAVIRAIDTLRSEFPDLRYDVVGNGPERSALERLVQERHLQTVITFHGAVDETRKWSLLQSADIFVMVPTIERQATDIEGFGLVYVEAAACGLPVVASDSGGIRDAVVDGQTGLLVAPGNDDVVVDALRMLLTDPAKAQRLGAQGRQRVASEFTDQVRLARLRQVLRFEPKHDPLVSVIIPAYQSADTIESTLQSVAQQTYQHREIIVVDDGSTDNLASVLSSWKDVITLIQQANSGAPRARNAGLDRSHGEYVLWLDADTVLEPTMIEQAVVALQTHPDIDVVYTDFRFGWKMFHLHEFNRAELERMNYIHTTSLVRRSAQPRFDPELKKFQDWDLWLTLSAQGRKFLWLPMTGFRVQPRQRGLGMSTWLPSFVYRLPFIGRGRGSQVVQRYRQAEAVIRAKHHLSQ